MSYNGEVFDPDSRWYAVWTRSRQEKVAAAMLRTLGIQHFLPLNSELRQWSDRKQLVEVPLFSGYLFVCISLLKNSKLQVLKIPGIGAFVGNQTGPLPIPDQQIEDIRTVVTAGVECSIHPFLEAGDRVRVVRGALAGVEGTLALTNSTSRLLISIEMIRQSLSVNVLRDDVELVRANSVPAMSFGHPAPPLGVQS
jgi:transcription antitermination factor NusG